MENPGFLIPVEAITGVILAGGLGRRMGGVNKGLQPMGAQPMVGHVIERLRPQVGTLMINANQDLAAYARFSYPVVSDVIEGFAGPLAGLHAALSVSQTPWVVTVPCDSPCLPLDLVFRLQAALTASPMSRTPCLAVARTGDQVHPVFCLCHRDALPGLTHFLVSGERKFGRWCATLPHLEVAFDDQPSAFDNINTPEALAALIERIRQNPL